MKSLRRRPFARIPIRLAFGLFAFVAAFAGSSNWQRNHVAPYGEEITTAEIRAGGQAAGRDFAETVAAARTVLHGAPSPEPFPPISILAYVPWALFSAPSYMLFSLVLILLLFGTIHICLRESGVLDGDLTLVIGILLSVAVYHSFWFQFEIERGNAETVSLVAAAAGLLMTSRNRPLAAICWFTLAAQWRAYPIALGLLLVPRFGIRRLVQFVGLNGLLLLALGWDDAKIFFSQMKSMMGANGWISPAHSLLVWLRTIGKGDSYQPLSMALTGVFLIAVGDWSYRSGGLVWRRAGDRSGLGEIIDWTFRLIRRTARFLLSINADLRAGRLILRWEPRRTRCRTVSKVLDLGDVALAGAVFQLMYLLPPTSIDYKLGLHVVPFLLLATRPRQSTVWRDIACTAGAVITGAAAGYVSSVGATQPAQASLLAFATYFVLVFVARPGDPPVAAAVTASATPVEEPSAALV